MQEAQEKLFRTVDRHYQTERNFLSKQFEKVAVYINDIFCALANHDARFEFDPLSLDDYRCEMVSATEINLICELKGFPECGFEVQGDGANGTVKIRLTDDYLERYGNFVEVIFDFDGTMCSCTTQHDTTENSTKT